MQFRNTPQSFTVGFELEITLRPKAASNIPGFRFEGGGGNNMTATSRENVNTIYTFLMLRLNCGVPFERTADPYTLWNVTSNHSVRGSDGFYGAEIRSPKYSGSAWRPAINYLFQTLDQFFHLNGNESCGTHIHVSRGDVEWPILELQAIARAVATYSGIFLHLCPDRDQSPYCQANCEDGQLEILRDINNTGCRDLIDLMSPMRNTVINFRSLHPLEDFRDTIKFRLFPATNSPETLEQYILSSLAFISASLRTQQDYYTEEMQDVTINSFRTFMTPHPDEAGHRVDHRALFHNKEYNSVDAQIK
ncbi:uncharacterized protein HD556DRAFT_1445701 [Suillus plorans]|uniref:Amidoligase enzyme n=1 Tax=Suillus plorans TaxID=116603 RepID=A0A9P7AJS2_9AGAM|nr:uncharacterized protein HD556DRAFT_1445701 [Suillus plorans]KAG1790929.1 hypothetical protein HD556DRAFT_1445701 [Suillus plorans]